MFLSQAVRKRLSEDILPIYTAKVQPGEEEAEEESERSSGTAILQDLRAVERKLAVVLELLAAVEGKNAAQAGPRDLCALVEKCRSSDIEVHPAIDAFLVMRELELMEVESDEFKSCLDPKCETGPGSCYAISVLSKDTKVQTIVQRKVICQHLKTILEKPHNSGLVQTFVAVVLQVETLCPDLREELLDLQCMLSPQDQEASVLKKLCQGRRKYIGHLLDTKATGIMILRAVASEWDQRLEDRQLATAVSEAMESVQTIDKVELTASGCLRKAVTFKICHLAVVKSTAGSAFFQRSHAEHLTKLKETLAEARLMLLNHFASSCAQGFVAFIFDDFDVLGGERERFKELDFDAWKGKIQSTSQEASQRLKAISEEGDAVRQDLSEQQKRWLGLSNGLRKFLSVIMGESGSSVFLDGEFEPFAALLFDLARDCQDRKGQDLLVKLRDLVFKCAVGCICTHEKVLAACAMCVRGEYAQVTVASEEQSACWAAAGEDEVITLVEGTRKGSVMEISSVQQIF